MCSDEASALEAMSATLYQVDHLAEGSQTIRHSHFKFPSEYIIAKIDQNAHNRHSGQNLVEASSA
jgi:hypothetical protein